MPDRPARRDLRPGWWFRAGKTTVLELFASAIAPTQGQALIAGADTTVDPLTSKRHGCFVSAQRALFSSLTARQNVECFLRLSQPKTPAARAAVDNAMRRVGMPERSFDRRCAELTNDVLALVWLAIARLRDCEALLLDDPTTRLTTRGAEEYKSP